MPSSHSRTAARWSFPNLSSTLLLGVVCAGLALPAWAQGREAAPELANVVNIAATSSVEVEQDWLTMNLVTTREGTDAASVQSELKKALDSALAVARPQAKEGQVEVRTGAFGLYPRYASNGKINGWRGSAELMLEGRDFALIGQLAGRIQTLTVGSVGFSLSRAGRQKVEAEVQAAAIDRFRSRALDVARSFGFSGYALREVAVSAADEGQMPVPARMMTMQAKSTMEDGSVPVEAGKSLVSVTVSGSIQLH